MGIITEIIIYVILPNRRYVDGVIVLARSIYESCRQLVVNFGKVGLGDWLMFQQVEKEYLVRNIMPRENYEFHITTIGYDGKAGRVVIKPTIPRNTDYYFKILEERQEHTARVVIKDYGIRRNMPWVHEEIQLTIPLEFYHRHIARPKNYGELYGGVDVNIKWINLAII